jgi:hypothetical protein
VSAVIVAIVAAALPVASTARLLRAASAPVQPSANPVQADAWIASMDRAARYVPGATCLATSIALAWILRRRGVDVVVKIGTRTEAEFSAHAWIESNGLPLTSARDGERTFTTVLSSETLRVRG